MYDFKIEDTLIVQRATVLHNSTHYYQFCRLERGSGPCRPDCRAWEWREHVKPYSPNESLPLDGSQFVKPGRYVFTSRGWEKV